MMYVEPGHAGLAGGQLPAVGAHYGCYVGLTSSGLVGVLLGDLVGDVDHGWEGGKGGVGVIPAHYPAACKTPRRYPQHQFTIRNTEDNTKYIVHQEDVTILSKT